MVLFSIHKVPKTVEIDYTNTYSEFIVRKPKWNTDCLLDYQKSFYDSFAYLMRNFTEPEHLPVLSELISKLFVDSAERSFYTSNSKHPKH